MENTVGNQVHPPIVNQNQTVQAVATQPVQMQSQPTMTPPIQPNQQTVQVPNYSGVNIQIFNPTVATPGTNINAPQYYPPNYYTNQLGNQSQCPCGKTVETNSDTDNSTKTKKEKRDIVLLTDDYIKSVENYLNSQDKKVRLMGAKEVAARLAEDTSRKDDKALTALINKMLQDPYQAVRFVALTQLSCRNVSGDELTKQLLQQMQTSKDSYGQDAMLATDILLKMSGQVVQKEFEVKETDKKKEDK